MLKKIKEVVESISGVPDISIKTRKQDIVFARFIYYGLAEELTNYSLAETSKIQNHDHATAIHARKEFKSLILRDEKYKQIYFQSKEFIINLKMQPNKNLKETAEDFSKHIDFYKEKLDLQTLLYKSNLQLKIANSKLESYANAKDFMELLEGLTPQHIEQAKDRLKPFIAICLSNQKRNSYYLNKTK